MYRSGHYFKTSFPMYDGSGHKEFCPGCHINFQHSRAYSNKSLLESVEASIAKGDLVVVYNRHQCDWDTGRMFMPTVVEYMESVEGFMFPDTQLGQVRHSYKDTFDGLSLLLAKPSVH